MNLSLSKGGLPASVKNRAWQYCRMAWRGMTSKKALSRLAALSPLLLLGVGQMASATDLLAGGKDDVKATFGADSFVMMCIIIAELIVGVAMYIRTKNLLILLGLVVVIVFTTVGLTFIS
ncbi:type IV conjugative transfer system pilin TraA [Escherichia coli]|uniref:type IV conjugative transfer system pilin TraA n=1 Tax=Escherichia coli TaxID=562 RepID=UPI001121C543|nr:type IV conjugative transfer system pilin TraA [Escherichia coli]EIY1064815.1 type IV conjugative transfer system pilin TraA [Escherichia coli]EKR7626149.1 type IV conjugative transfer system pilin TraA [Escherichia coli]TPD02079.1 type IV conjugative transfer system pilin TraA [Escherichia coli]HCT7898574.1 type IV conjugative transfer system pilin TraA [Enterobacter cloacae]